NGTRPPRFGLSTRPVQAMVSILRQASRPPRAAAFLSRTWAAVRVCAVAGSAANAAAAADAARAQAAKRLIDMAGGDLPRGLLELVGVPAFDDLRDRELDLRSLPLEVDQRAVELGRRRGRPGLGRGVVLDLVAVEVRPQLPALVAVPHLHRRLLLELVLQAALLRAFHAHHERQLRILLP